VCTAVEATLPKEWTGRDWMFGEANASKLIAVFLRKRDEVHALVSQEHVLTPAQRQVFELYYRWGKGQQEIADELGVRRKTVDEHLLRARKRIQRHLNRMA